MSGKKLAKYELWRVRVSIGGCGLHTLSSPEPVKCGDGYSWTPFSGPGADITGDVIPQLDWRAVSGVAWRRVVGVEAKKLLEVIEGNYELLA